MYYLNMHEAKTNLSGYINRLKPEEVIILCRRNVPVAEIRLLPSRPERHIGVARGEFRVPDDFNDPLPADILESFANPQ
ncbi:type II toxin-antitoxin system Phd/YefM family antitoxin [bacterium CPR1]|nr:type II toxin-antitoxin system Phd/YefM family antitoxin [bacterium CPR1]